MIDRSIAFDITAAGLLHGGTHVYTAEMRSALGAVLGKRLIPLECPHTRHVARRRTWRDRGHTLLRDLWWYQGAAARQAARRGASLLHSPVPTRRQRVPLVTTVFDLASLRYPQAFRPWFRNFARTLMPGMIRSADAIITISQASRMEICEMLHVPEERVHVVYCGIADDFSHAEESAANDAGILTGLGVDGPFLLSVGALEPRKNLDRALEAFAVLRGQPQFRDMRLVHVGPEGWLSSHVPALVRSLGIESDVRFLGVVPRPALAALYRAARVTVYVSLYEGFGLPVAESMACGTPVVTSNRSSMPEVAGGAALLVDPLSIDSIVQGIASAWSDEELRRTLRSRGLARARAFDWSNAAGETARVYERVLELRAA